MKIIYHGKKNNLEIQIKHVFFLSYEWIIPRMSDF
jgi:hypothetical protein